jgi:hypothetical protein
MFTLAVVRTADTNVWRDDNAVVAVQAATLAAVMEV